MEIIQSKRKKVISALIVLIMIVNMTMPIFAATYTGSVNVGDKLKFTGSSWTIYKTKTAAENLDKSKTYGTLKKNTQITIQSKSGNVLQIGSGQYIYYGSTAGGNFTKVSSASNTTKPTSNNTTKVNTEAAGSIASGIVGIVSAVVKSIVSIISGLISNRTTTTPTVTPTNGITLNKTTVELYVGKTYQLTANKQVNWSSSNNAVATISSKGVITAKSKGSATITASCNGASKTCNVNVKNAGESNNGTITTSTIVKTNASGAFRTVTKAELQKIINNASITSTGKRRANLNSQIDTFMKIQNDYNVNAVFAIAVAIQESGAGTSSVAKSKNNWFGIMSGGTAKKYASASDSILGFGKLISGKTYFGSGKIKIKDIGNTYCGASWVNSITSNMKSLYKYI